MKFLPVLSAVVLLVSGQSLAQSINAEALEAQITQQTEELQKLKDTMQQSQRDLEIVQDKIKSSDYQALQLGEKIESLCAKLAETSAGDLSNPVCKK